MGTIHIRGARTHNLDLTCLGYGGQCHLDPIVASMIRDLPADQKVVEGLEPPHLEGTARDRSAGQNHGSHFQDSIRAQIIEIHGAFRNILGLVLGFVIFSIFILLIRDYVALIC